MSPEHVSTCLSALIQALILEQRTGFYALCILVCLCDIWGWGECAMACLFRSEDNLVELALSLIFVSSGDQTQVWQALYPLSHLPA